MEGRGSQEEPSQDARRTPAAGPVLSSPPSRGPMTGTTIKGVPERDAALRGGVPDSNGDQDRELRPLLTGAKMEQIPSHHRKVFYFMLRERRDLPTN